MRFEPIQLAPYDPGERGYLGFFRGKLAVILVELQVADGPEAQPHFYLDHGYGSCDQEGWVFPDLPSAERWVFARLTENECVLPQSWVL
jgi:hypothetical protein